MPAQTASTTLALPAGSYIYTLLPTPAGIAALSSDDSVRLFSADTLAVTHVLPNTNKSVTSLKPVSAGGEVVATAGRDGVVRCWDSREAGRTGGNDGTRGMGGMVGDGAKSGKAGLVAAGTENEKDGRGDEAVLVWDMRMPGQALRSYTETHSDTITELSFHPRQPHTLLSASTDGIASLFNTTVADEDDALLQQLPHNSAIHLAGFIAPSVAYAISCDEQCSFYALTAAEDEEEALPVAALGDVRPRLGCAYVVDVLPAFQARHEGSWIAVGDTETSRLDLIAIADSPSWHFVTAQALSFEGAHGDEIVRGVPALTTSQTFFTCGEDGHVRAWNDDTPVAEPEEMDVDVDGDGDGDDNDRDDASAKARRHRQRSKAQRASARKGRVDDGRGRYAPY
ncbi:WD domain-containing protein [Cryomyces antarcticus]